MRGSISGRTAAVALAVGLFVSVLSAMPPLDWSWVTRDALQKRLNSGVDVVRRPVRDAGRKGVVNGPGEIVPLVTGTKLFPAVVINYTDQTNVWSAASFDTMLFRTWPSGSARQYYSEISYGVFDLTGAVYGWYTSDSNRAYYGNGMGSARAAALAKEAARKSDATVDYSLYDNDRDGYVDCFTCIHSGYGTEESGDDNDIWSHSWSFSSAGIGIYTTGDPDPVNGGYIKVDDYVIDPERTYKSNPGHSGMCCIGVYCHEWGHALGLPDLYDTDGGSSGLGTWDLMAAGSWGGDFNSPAYPVHPNSWAKMQLGWLNPVAVRRRNLYSIAQVETLAKAYWLISRQRTFQEYFLVENRRKTRFDVNLPNSGLLIFHIDDSVIAARTSSNRVNAGGSWKYGVALEQADGSDHLFSGGNWGDANDPWPGGQGKTLFDSTSTTPDSRTNYPTGGELVTSSFAKNIPSSASVVSCSLSSGVVGAFTGGPDARGYSWIDSDTAGGPTYVWNDISTTGTLLGTGDDNLYSLTLPYSFYFYGNMQTSTWVSTNGWLSFGSSPGTSAPTNTTIPSSSSPNQAAFVFWDDLNLVAGDSSGIFYQHFGTTPNCSTIIMWKDARRRGVNGGSLNPLNQVSFEIVLYEGGKIVMRYRDCSVGDARYNWGRDASAGIENDDGTIGLEYLANGQPLGNLLASERAVQYACGLNDAGVMSIVAPAGTVDSGSAGIAPQAWVRNFGISSASFPVWLRVAPSYLSNQYDVSNLVPGDSLLVDFAPDWVPVLRGSHITKCSTRLAGDNATGNDTFSSTVSVRVRDVGSSKIEFPAGTVDSGTSITPACSVYNYGTNMEGGYLVRMLVGTGPAYYYNGTATAPNVNPGERGYVAFSSTVVNWPRGGPYAVRCSTELAGDAYASNNRAPQGTVSVQVRDVVCSKIEFPFGTVDSGASVAPVCSVANYGMVAEGGYLVRMLVGTGPAYYYNGTATAPNVNPGERGYVAFSSTVVNWPRGGPYPVRCSTELTSDAIRSNNEAPQGTVSVQVRDVGCSKILYPSGTIDSGASVTPACSVANYGTTTEGSYTVRMLVGTGPAYLYTGTATAPDVNPGQRGYVAFSSTVADWPRGGPYTVRCSTEFTNDANRGNNQAPQGTVSVQVRDVGCSKIEFPFGTVDSGASITPACSVYNYGMTTEGGYTVRMLVGSGPSYYYNGTATAPSVNPGQRGYVGFSSTVVNWPRGGPYPVRCSTEFTSDAILSNNEGPQRTVSVQVRDVGCSKIEVPVGTVDSGASVTPACSVYNYGMTTEGSYTVRMLVGTGPSYYYNGTATAPGLNPGEQGYVVFSTTTANWPRGGPYAVRCSTELASDSNRSNNQAPQQSVSVQVRDVGSSRILYPSGTIDSGASITPACTVANYGTSTEGGYLVRMLVGTGPSYLYNGTATAPDVNPGQRGYVAFSPVTVTWPRGTHAVNCSTELAADAISGNDRAPSRTTTVRVIDVGCTKIEFPFGTLDSGASITPACSVYNYGTTREGGYLIRMLVGTGPSYFYNATEAAPVHNSGEWLYIEFPPVTVNWPRGGPYPVHCSTELSADDNRSNSSAPQRTVSVQVRDVGCTKIESPFGTVDSGASITPACSVSNYGTTTEGGYLVRMLVGTGPSYIYNGTAVAPSLNSGQSGYVVFSTTFAAWPRGGPYPVRCSTEFTNDANRSNNPAPQRTVSVQVRDVGCLSILAPTGDVDSVGPLSPQARVKNFGNQDLTAPFDVVFTIGSYSSVKSVPALAPGVDTLLVFDSPPWGCPRGPFSGTCATQFSGDMNPANDQQVTSGQVRVVDVGCEAILAPVGDLDSTGPRVPQARVSNYGDQDVTTPFDVAFVIGAYRSTKQVPSLARGESVVLDFDSPPWGCPRGAFTALCTTLYAGDAGPGNNAQMQTGTIRVWDVGPAAINAPAGEVPMYSTVTPSVVVQNFGTNDVTCSARLTIRDAQARVLYDLSEGGVFVAAGGQTTHTFSALWTPHETGRCSVEARTGYGNDANPFNDIQRSLVKVVPLVRTGWSQQANLPQGMRGKNVKDGGALAYGTTAGNDSGFVYGFKGNSTTEFYRFNTRSGAWIALDTIPPYNRLLKKKGVKKGALLVVAGNGHVYATKGNNTLDWWEYTPQVGRGTWVQKADVPVGAKKVKEGTGAVAVTEGGADYIYLLKGSATFEFYRYNVSADAWEAMPNTPMGGGKPYKTGSALAYDGVNTIYAVKGSVNEFFGYNIPGRYWLPLEILPLGNSRKKVKDGAGLGYDNGIVYGLKGGNTNEFWTFETWMNRWLPAQPMGTSSLGRRVKGGGGLVTAAGKSALYAFRGNNTLEFWSYGVPILGDEPRLAAGPSGAQGADAVRTAEFGLRIEPNPVAQSVNPSISYSLPAAGNVSLRLFDLSGKLVRTLASGYHAAGNYSSQLTANSSQQKPAAGVYLLKLESDGRSTTEKLVIE